MAATGIMYGAPAERSHGVESGFEYDGWRAASTAVDLHVPAADVDETPLHGKLSGGPPTHDLLVAGAYEYCCDDEAADE